MKIIKLLPYLLAGTALATPAFAQESSVEPANASVEDTGEIVVIAQRRESRYVDVAGSISVVTGDQLESAGVRTSRSKVHLYSQRYAALARRLRARVLIRMSLFMLMAFTWLVRVRRCSISTAFPRLKF